ncbi:MAG: hypothetical protein HQL50_10585, partial [Magnetococcales bacterium]|nr:hypothetical protein [Magnetococcales bacterium]
MSQRHQRTPQILATGLLTGLTSFAELESRLDHFFTEPALTVGPGTEKETPSSLPESETDSLTATLVLEVLAEALLTIHHAPFFREAHATTALSPQVVTKIRKESGQQEILSLIHGVAIAHSGEAWAWLVIHSPDRTPIKPKAYKQFLEATEAFSGRILITNADELPKSLDRLPRLFSLRGRDLDRLETNDFRRLNRWLHTGQGEPKPQQRTASRTRLLTALFDRMVSQPVVTVQTPPGWQSGTVLSDLIDRLGPRRTVWALFSTVTELRQTVHTLQREARPSSLAL